MAAPQRLLGLGVNGVAAVLAEAGMKVPPALEKGLTAFQDALVGGALQRTAVQPGLQLCTALNLPLLACNVQVDAHGQLLQGAMAQLYNGLQAGAQLAAFASSQGMKEQQLLKLQDRVVWEGGLAGQECSSCK